MERKNNEELLLEFAKTHELGSIKRAKPRNCIIYTRVSSSKQLGNQSLETQLEACKVYAEKNDLSILEYFGGVAESAKTDDRKEFDRMWKYAVKNHKNLSNVVVFSLDRFSRTGGNALQKLIELKETYGISVDGVNLPADSSVFGDLLKALSLYIAKIDNNSRTEKAVIGMRKRLEKGRWVGMLGIGYEVKKVAGADQYFITWEGELIKNAFKWKDEGYLNSEIDGMLRKKGLALPKNTLHRIFSNIFYTGYIKHGLINDKVFLGIHPAIVDTQVFLRINSKKKKGTVHKKGMYSLASFARDMETNSAFAGYSTKNRYGKSYSYYKANKIGAKVNRDREFFEGLFAEFLDSFRIKEDQLSRIRKALIQTFATHNQEILQHRKEAEQNLQLIKTQYENLISEYYLRRGISKSDFELLKPKLESQGKEAIELCERINRELSNPEEFVSYSLELCNNLRKMWVYSDVPNRKTLQNLVFPEGILFDSKKDEYRTTKLNSCLELISRLSTSNEPNENGTEPLAKELSHSAVWTGLEPATSCVTGRHSNQLNYQTIV